jgi:hypothetical protein
LDKTVFDGDWNFALVVTGQTMTMVMKEKRASQEQLDKAQRTVGVITGNSHHIN